MTTAAAAPARGRLRGGRVRGGRRSRSASIPSRCSTSPATRATRSPRCLTRAARCGGELLPRRGPIRGRATRDPPPARPRLEYIAAIALIAAILAVAAPAVGAPDIRRPSSGKLRLALCLVATTSARPRMAADAGLAPCPLRSDLTGPRGSRRPPSASRSATGVTLTVTPHSDGTRVGRPHRRRPSRACPAGVGADVALGPGHVRARGPGGRPRPRPGRARLAVPGPGDGRPLPRARARSTASTTGACRPPGIRSRAADEVSAHGRPGRSAARASAIAACSAPGARRRHAALGARLDRDGRRDRLRPARDATGRSCRCRSCRRRSATGARSGSSSTRSAARAARARVPPRRRERRRTAG